MAIYIYTYNIIIPTTLYEPSAYIYYSIMGPGIYPAGVAFITFSAILYNYRNHTFLPAHNHHSDQVEFEVYIYRG